MDWRRDWGLLFDADVGVVASDRVARGSPAGAMMEHGRGKGIADSRARKQEWQAESLQYMTNYYSIQKGFWYDCLEDSIVIRIQLHTLVIVI